MSMRVDLCSCKLASRIFHANVGANRYHWPRHYFSNYWIYRLLPPVGTSVRTNYRKRIKKVNLTKRKTLYQVASFKVFLESR